MALYREKIGFFKNCIVPKRNSGSIFLPQWSNQGFVGSVALTLSNISTNTSPKCLNCTHTFLAVVNKALCWKCHIWWDVTNCSIYTCVRSMVWIKFALWVVGSFMSMNPWNKPNEGWKFTVKGFHWFNKCTFVTTSGPALHYPIHSIGWPAVAHIISSLQRYVFFFQEVVNQC